MGVEKNTTIVFPLLIDCHPLLTLYSKITKIAHNQATFLDFEVHRPLGHPSAERLSPEFRELRDFIAGR